MGKGKEKIIHVFKIVDVEKTFLREIRISKQSLTLKFDWDRNNSFPLVWYLNFYLK